jgi:hypothetical protein
MDRLAGLFGAGHPAAPVPPDHAGLPAERGTTGAADRPPGAPPSEPVSGGTAKEEPAKKKGFWAKIFGKKEKGR